MRAERDQISLKSSPDVNSVVSVQGDSLQSKLCTEETVRALADEDCCVRWWGIRWYSDVVTDAVIYYAARDSSRTHLIVLSP